MNLQSYRLNFKQVSLDDIADVHHLHSLPATDRYNTLGIPETILQTQDIINEWLAEQNATPPTLYVFCLRLTDSKQFVGLMALNVGKPDYKTAEVWYKIHPAHWGKGYATEALKELLAFGFNECQLHRIEAGCAVENIASRRVLEKVGMTREGMKRKKLLIRGQWVDNYFYAILEEDFLQLISDNVW